MSKLMSLEKIKGRIKSVIEVTEYSDYSSLKELRKESGMPEYQLKALLKTKFLFKYKGCYNCRDLSDIKSSETKEEFISKLAEGVRLIYLNKGKDIVASYESSFNYLNILKDLVKEDTDVILEKDVKTTKKNSFWIKIKKFFKC